MPVLVYERLGYLRASATNPLGGKRRIPAPQALKKLESAMRDLALGYPETEETFPWGERAMKGEGQDVLFMRLGDTELSFSVKLPRTGNSGAGAPVRETDRI